MLILPSFKNNNYRNLKLNFFNWKQWFQLKVKNNYTEQNSDLGLMICQFFVWTYPRELWYGLSKFSKKFTFLCQIFCLYSIYVLHTLADRVIKPPDLKDTRRDHFKAI